MKAYYYEVIRILKNKNTKIIILLLLLCELGVLLSLHNVSRSEDVFNGTETWGVMSSLFDHNRLSEEDQNTLIQIDDEEMKQVELFKYYKSKEEWEKMLLSGIDYRQYCAQIYSFYLALGYDGYFRNKGQLDSIIQEFDFINLSSYKDYTRIEIDGEHIFPWALHDMQYFYELYKQKLTPMTYSHVDSSTVFLQLLRNILALLLPLLIPLMFFYDRTLCHKTGVDKVIMTIPSARKKFVRTKVLAHSTIVILMIFVPIMIATFVLGLFDHFQNFTYPVFSNTAGIHGFRFSIFEFLNSIEMDPISNYGIVATSFNMQLNPFMEFIPSWQVTVLSAVFLILLVFFYVQLNFFFTRLFKNAYLGLTINLMIVLLLIYLSPQSSTAMYNIINPFTYRDPGLLVMGTSYYPWSIGMLVITVYNVGLYLINKILLKFKWY